MKKFFTLVTAFVLATGAFANDYTDTLVVTVNGASTSQPATISLNQNENGTYNFSLKNFVLGSGKDQMAIGNINLDNVEGETKDGVLSMSVDRDIRIVPGDDPNVKAWMGPAISAIGAIPVRMIAEQRGEKLYTVINIDLSKTMHQIIKVVFGGGYQIPNSGFENFHTARYGTISSEEPNAWHSFQTAGGDFAMFANTVHNYKSTNAHSGSYSAKLVATNAVITIANGTMTTGRMNAGSWTASDPANHAALDMSVTDKDGNGDPYYVVMNGLPDSLAVWVKYGQAKPTSAHPYATVSAIITDGTYYQDPEDRSYDNKLAEARDRTIAATNDQWKRISIPFNYIDRSVKGKAILITISTNADAGQGSEGDSILVDDISLIYNAPKATAISVKGDAVEGFEAGKSVEISNKYTNLSPEDIVVTTDNSKSKVFKTMEEKNGTTTITIKVASNDLNSVATYTLVIPGTTGVKAIEVNDAETADAPAEIYNVAGQRVNDMQPGQVYVVKKGGKTVKVLKK